MGSMATDIISLRWKDFESNLTQSFSSMRDNSDFFDVKVACFDNKSEMKTISAHKMVLSACSPVFKKILLSIGTGDAKNALVFLKGISYEDISSILDFMYNGQTNIEHKELDAFLAAAEELKIRGLCRENKKSEVNSNNLTSSRKRPFEDKQEDVSESDVNVKSKIKKIVPLSPSVPQKQSEDSFGKGLGLKSTNKKPRASIANIRDRISSSMEVFIPEDNFEKMVVKTEQVNHETEEHDYQDYTETEMVDPFEESTDQDHDKSGTDNSSTDSKGISYLIFTFLCFSKAVSVK